LGADKKEFRQLFYHLIRCLFGLFPKVLSREGCPGAVVRGNDRLERDTADVEQAAAIPKAAGDMFIPGEPLWSNPLICLCLGVAYVAGLVFESSALPTALQYRLLKPKGGTLRRVAGGEIYLGLVGIGVAGVLTMTWVN
jgi:hypothetical protein